MRTSLKLFWLAGVLCAGLLAAQAADKKHLGGPGGGRFLEKTDPKAEFFLEKDRRASITFYDATLKPVAVATQKASLIAETKQGKQRIEFEKQGDRLVSQQKLPEGEGYNLVLQFRQTPDAKPQNFRFKLETHNCAGCNRAEYACTCDE